MWRFGARGRHYFPLPEVQSEWTTLTRIPIRVELEPVQPHSKSYVTRCDTCGSIFLCKWLLYTLYAILKIIFHSSVISFIYFTCIDMVLEFYIIIIDVFKDRMRSSIFEYIVLKFQKKRLILLSNFYKFIDEIDSPYEIFDHLDPTNSFLYFFQNSQSWPSSKLRQD